MKVLAETGSWVRHELYYNSQTPLLYVIAKSMILYLVLLFRAQFLVHLFSILKHAFYTLPLQFMGSLIFLNINYLVYLAMH